MAARIATLLSPAPVRARLQASLYYARERRQERQGPALTVPVISSATPSGSNVPVSGTSVAGALVVVYVDGTEAARARADAAGAWATEVQGLAAATYAFTATATSYGKTSAPSAATGVIVA